VTAFESRRADDVRPGDIIHTRSGVHMVSLVFIKGNFVKLTCTDSTRYELLADDLVHTEREPK